MEGKINITKKDLVEEISLRTGLVQVEIKTIIEQFLENLTSGLSNGNNAEIRGFGRFKLKSRKERIARNPRTGETVKVPPGIKPVFEASKDLIKSLNEVLATAEIEHSTVKSND